MQDVGQKEKVSSDKRQVVLVIEDDDGVRGLVLRMLAHMGYSAREAADGASGIAAFESDPDGIACVLLDLSMPRMNGSQVLAAILDCRPSARVVLMSGFDHEEVAVRFADQGIAGTLQKPFKPNELRDCITRVLS